MPNLDPPVATASPEPAGSREELLVSVVDLQQQIDELRGAIPRISIIEQAKGVLMERFAIGEQQAFEQIRNHARPRGAKVIDVSLAIIATRGLSATSRTAGLGTKPSRPDPPRESRRQRPGGPSPALRQDGPLGTLDIRPATSQQPSGDRGSAA